MAFESLKKKKTVFVSGWAEEVRLFGGLAFIILRNRNGTLQLTFKKDKNDKLFEEVRKVTIESFVSAKGAVQLSEKARNGFEILVDRFDLENKADALPLDISGKIESDLSVRFDYRYLDLRQKKNQNIFLLRSKVVRYITDYMESQGFVDVNTPKLTTIGAESGAELFKLDYFGKPAYLSQSPQIYKQMLQCAGFEKVFEIGAVFRAEKSRTVRHLTEFTGYDMEMSNATKLHHVTDVLEGCMKYVCKTLEKKDKQIVDELELKFNVPKKFPVVKFYDAVSLLKEKYNKVIEDDDLDAEAEKILGQHFLEKDKSDFVFVTDYPMKKRPFYHRYNKDKKTTNSFDLLYKGQEITTGSLREHRYDVLVQQAKEKGIETESMLDYLNMFKYGMPPHGGYGCGIDRIVQKMVGIENVKECVLFPRDPERLRP